MWYVWSLLRAAVNVLGGNDAARRQHLFGTEEGGNAVEAPVVIGSVGAQRRFAKGKEEW